MPQLRQFPVKDPSPEGVDLVSVMLEGDGPGNRTALFKFVVHNLSNVEDVAVRVRVAVPGGSLDAAARHAWQQLAEGLEGVAAFALDVSNGI